MFEIVIFDDDKLQCRLLKELVEKNCGRKAKVMTVTSRQELTAWVQDGHKIDILVSDIYLKGDSVNGIDVVKQLLMQNGLTQIIYITGYVEYCVDVYETEHVYFLKKPVEEVKLKNALEKAFDNLDKLLQNVLVIYNAGKIIRILMSEILYMESDKRKIRIVCVNQEYETYDKISNMREKLGAEFVQCHKSCLVNMYYIRELKRDRILLANGMEVMVSRNQYRETKETFLNYISKI